MIGVHRRRIEKAVQKLRRAGKPIVSLTSAKLNGYYIPDNLAEAIPFRRQMAGRLSAISSSLCEVDKTLRELYGPQIPLPAVPPRMTIE